MQKSPEFLIREAQAMLLQASGIAEEYVKNERTTITPWEMAAVKSLIFNMEEFHTLANETLGGYPEW